MSLQSLQAKFPPLRRLVAGILFLTLAPGSVLAETAVERAARTGELSLGVYGNIPPYVQSTAKGEMEGYAIDVASLIAAEVSDYLGKPIKVVTATSKDADELFRRVHNGEIDVVCGAQFTWEREMFVDFSIPFGLSGIRLMTAGKGIDGTPDSLRGKRVGVLPGSLGEATIKALQPAAQLMPLATIKEGVAAVGSGKIDAMAGDSLLLATAAATAGAAPGSVALVPVVPYNRYAVGCIVPENNSTLRNLVNLAVARMIQGYVNGVPRYTQLVNRWLGPQSIVGLPEEMIKGYFQTVLLNHEQIRVPTSP